MAWQGNQVLPTALVSRKVYIQMTSCHKAGILVSAIWELSDSSEVWQKGCFSFYLHLRATWGCCFISEQDTQQVFLFFLEVSNCVRKKDETGETTKNIWYTAWMYIFIHVSSFAFVSNFWASGISSLSGGTWTGLLEETWPESIGGGISLKS